MFAGGSDRSGSRGRDLEHTALGIKKGLSSFFQEETVRCGKQTGRNGLLAVTITAFLTVASPWARRPCSKANAVNRTRDADRKPNSPKAKQRGRNNTPDPQQHELLKAFGKKCEGEAANRNACAAGQ